MENEIKKEWHRIPNCLRTFEERKRYKDIKTQMINGVMVPREDFLFIRGVDRREQARTNMRLRFGHLGGIRNGGFNTNPK